jgi:uncharacterized protein (DUF849 family)
VEQLLAHRIVHAGAGVAHLEPQPALASPQADPQAISPRLVNFKALPR